MSTRHATSAWPSFHQDLALADNASILDNVRIKMYGAHGLSRIHWNRERKQVEASIRSLGLNVPVKTPARELSEAQRTIVAIARAMGELNKDMAGVLVVDEATASLTASSVRIVFQALQTLAKRGCGVLYVSHRLEEVLELANSVTVLRDGQVVMDSSMEGVTRADLVNAIVGETYSEYTRDRHSTLARHDDPRFSLTGLTGGVVSDLGIDGVSPGEVVGVTGLIGSGYEDVVSLVFGAKTAQSGTMTWIGEEIELPALTPARARSLGFAYVAPTRLGMGALGSASVRENVSLPWLGKFSSSAWIRSGSERNAVLEILRAFDVRPDKPEAIFQSLSGGNQQKALLGRELAARPGLLLLAEPTHGIDVAAKSEILRRIRAYADDGNIALVASSEVEELVRVCDRIVVLKNGARVGELEGDDITLQRVMQLCYS